MALRGVYYLTGIKDDPVHVPEPEQTICILKQNDKNHSMESDLISVIAGYKSYFIGELKIKL